MLCYNNITKQANFVNYKIICIIKFKVMKKRFYLIAGNIILLAAFLVYFTSCDKNGASSGATHLNADDARVEIRAASQEISTTLEELMSSQAATSLDYLFYLGDGDFTLKSNLMPALSEIGELKVRPYKELIISKYSIANEPDPKVGGVYQYNYDTGEFDLVNPNVSYLRFIYPADDMDYIAGGHNAELTVYDYDYFYDEYNDEIPTDFNIELIVYGDLAMSFLYQGIYDDDGIPTSISVDINMPPYTLTMNESVSGSNYVSSLYFKLNNEVLMSYDLAFTLTPDKEEVDRVSGHYQITPLKVDGYMNVANIDNCNDDINCMNSNMDLKLYLTTQNALIGSIEFRMIYDDYWDEDILELVVIYEDNSEELLSDIFDMR